MDWYSDCKRISKQEVELPKHQSGSSEVASHGHYRSQESQRHDVDDQTVRKAIGLLQWKRRLAAVTKQNGGPRLFSTFSADQLTDDYCDVLV